MSSKSKKGPRALRPVPVDPAIARFLKGDNVPVPRPLVNVLLAHLNELPRGKSNGVATQLEILLNKFPAPPQAAAPAPAPEPEKQPAEDPKP